MRALPLAFVVLALLSACNAGDEAVTPGDVAAPGPDFSMIDAVAEIAAPDGAADGAAELPGIPDVADVGSDAMLPACEPGDGCFLDPCAENADCLSGWCVEHMGEGVCTMPCTEECPEGWSCQQVGGTDPDVIFICVSDFANLCKPCASGAGCAGAGGADDVCVDYGDEGSFCGGACDADGDCPEGFTCQADAETVDGVVVSQCVSEAGTCACTATSVALALWTPCVVENEAGACAGKRVCTADGLSDCDAGVPGAELCNGLDDDCDGEADEPDLVDGQYVALCDDGNPCTNDACDPEVGCTYTLNAAPCDDGNPCTTGDHCQDGSCSSDGLADCDDQDPCTTDLCEPTTGGCVHSLNEGPCDDGDLCTTGDHCALGDCIAAGLLVCDDGNPCTTDSCDPIAGCESQILYPCCGNDLIEPPETCDDGNQDGGDGCDALCQDEDVGGCVKIGVDVRTLEQGPEDYDLGYCDSTYCEDTPRVIPFGWHIASIAEVAHLVGFVQFGSCGAYGVCGSYWYGGGELTANCTMLQYTCTTGGCTAYTEHCYTQVLLIKDGKDGTCHTGP